MATIMGQRATDAGTASVQRRASSNPGKANGRRRAPSPLADTSPSAEESQRMLAAQQGDRDALTQVVELYQRAVYGYLRSRLIDATDADDLCQEVFLRCYTGRARYNPTAPVRPWLIGVARNVLREHIRKLTRRKEVAWTELCLEMETMVEPEEGLYDDVMGHLPVCLQSLGPSARQALELHYRDKFKLSTISDRLHRSLGAVKLLMYRSRQAVKHCIDGKVEAAGAS